MKLEDFKIKKKYRENYIESIILTTVGFWTGALLSGVLTDKNIIVLISYIVIQIIIYLTVVIISKIKDGN